MKIKWRALDQTIRQIAINNNVEAFLAVLLFRRSMGEAENISYQNWPTPEKKDDK